ncbi:Dihydroflavonol-4-reductase [Triticum urartu]|uniref:Dihydroflavonol-4-reductase n=1 Tax=Triticum urartu TaxID=4572 RepID=M8ACB2_TRIUA|nr:Dihydroflavonol-4-reductase [Triticum urartu]
MSKVCVTGAAGYIASWLVKKLLERGCTVHGTLRNLGDEKKTGLLRGLPGAAERLVLFEADIYDAASFEPAIQGCEFVFLVATPLQHNSGSSKERLFRGQLTRKTSKGLWSLSDSYCGTFGRTITTCNSHF